MSARLLWIALKTRDCLPLGPDWRMDRPQKITFAEMRARLPRDESGQERAFAGLARSRAVETCRDRARKTINPVNLAIRGRKHQMASK